MYPVCTVMPNYALKPTGAHLPRRPLAWRAALAAARGYFSGTLLLSVVRRRLNAVR